MLGKVVAFEGIDGSGKGTVIKNLVSKLEDVGKTCTVIVSPTASTEDTGKLCRKSLLNGYSQETQFFLMLADRTIINSRILKAKENFDYVLLDRYVLSTLAYQADCILRHAHYFEVLCDEAVKVDATVFLNISVDLAISRILARGGEMVDSFVENNLRNIYKNYQTILVDFLEKWNYNNLIGDFFKVDIFKETSVEEITGRVYSLI
jgi:dTMP kinase